MSHVVATVLVSLSLPAIALAIIVWLERRAHNPENPPQIVVAEHELATNLDASAPVTLGAEDGRYRERAG